jgi:hypothetical protein
LKLLSAQPDTLVDETVGRPCEANRRSRFRFHKIFFQHRWQRLSGPPPGCPNRPTSLHRFCFFVSPFVLLLFCMQPMMQGWYVACFDKSNGGAIFDLK